MLAMVRSRRAWLYVLSAAALFVPAGGIAYLGAVSYRNERGAVSAQNERQRQAALGIASRISRAIDDALDATERAVASGTRSVAAPLARHWFWVDGNQRLRVPHSAPASEPSAGLERAGCASGRLEDCVHELATRQSRIARLHAAQRAEAGSSMAGSSMAGSSMAGSSMAGSSMAGSSMAGASWAEARRQYAQLAAFADTGPSALLGLARMQSRFEDGRAGETLAELERRFGDRSFDGIPVRLVVATLRAEAAGEGAAAALRGVAGDVLAGNYALAPVAQVGVLGRLRSRLAELAPDEARALDGEIAELRAQARAAAGLADDLPEVIRSATPAWRGRAAAREPGRTVIFRRRADGGVIGLAVDAPMLEAAAGSAIATDDTVAIHQQLLVLPPGTSPGTELRTIQQVPLGAALPHLSVAIVNPLADPDPLDEVIRERSKRHVMYTSALAIALGLGLLATIRGAARARELARLKSDFVSTVSHELKTPLTSIRMFAEMLEQGVAQGDPAKMARYHGVIVQESQRLGLLIANLLDYAQIEKGTRRYAQTRQRIAELARHAVTTFETLRDPETARNPLTVAVSTEATRADVEVDRDVVVGAVLNLLANAAKYGGTAQPIEVAIDSDAAAAWIAVRDHGPGIPAAEQARIFREFYRAPEAHSSGVEGTGLGLALVKRHIEALGGTVDVASTVGDGATFTIRLPRASGPEAG
jgi:signal transduction histidine kinase